MQSRLPLWERAALGGQGGRVKLVDICPLRWRFLLTDFRLSLMIRRVRPRSGFGGGTRKGQQPCGLWPTVWVPASAASGGLKHWEKLSFRAVQQDCTSHRCQSVGKKCVWGSPESRGIGKPAAPKKSVKILLSRSKSLGVAPPGLSCFPSAPQALRPGLNNFAPAALGYAWSVKSVLTHILKALLDPHRDTTTLELL